jgi:hypothetical protein
MSGYTLTDVMPRPPRRRRTGLIVGLAVGGLLLAVAAWAVTTWLTRPSGHATAAATTTSPTPTATIPVGDYAAQACTRLDETLGHGPLDPDTMISIGNLAAKSSNDSVRIDGGLLAWSAGLDKKAIAAGDLSQKYPADLDQMAHDLRGQCVEAGFLNG